MEYSGEYLVKLARRTIDTYLKNKTKIKPPKDAPADLMDQSGVFVTLHRIDQGDEPVLRGCIGRIQSPGSTLLQSTIDSAIDAIIHDYRFPNVTLSELDKITVEVTILTVPEKITVEDPKEYFNIIKIGRHGLIAERNSIQRGLLLPQVPVQQGWNVQKYLNYVCQKAGLPSDAWQDLDTTISSFEGFIFSEISPNGIIEPKSDH
ncbi:MAG: TIGR00296 family protein [Candidatus Hodarchaeales archaeon]